MSNFVDKLRGAAPVRKSIWCIGIDPDMDTIGFGIVRVDWTDPISHSPTFSNVSFGIFDLKIKGITGLDKSNRVVQLLPRFILNIIELTYVYITIPRVSVVEAQRTYPIPDEPMGKVVAQANDLHRLAQISGAAQAILGENSRMVFPTEWKAQGSKAGTVMKIQSALKTSSVAFRHYKLEKNSVPQAAPVFHDVRSLLDLRGVHEHGLDALGMALFSANQYITGVWHV